MGGVDAGAAGRDPDPATPFGFDYDRWLGVSLRHPTEGAPSRPRSVGSCADGRPGMSQIQILEFAGTCLEDATVGDSAFGSVRQRVIRHLLALAEQEPAGVTYRVTITQQQLADAVGSPREVVGRVLGQARREELVRTTRGEGELLNLNRLVSSLNAWRSTSPY